MPISKNKYNVAQGKENTRLIIIVDANIFGRGSIHAYTKSGKNRIGNLIGY